MSLNVKRTSIDATSLESAETGWC